MSLPPVVIEVDQLTKRFGPVTAVDALSFTVRPGQVTGFLGPNGAGKTTTMRVILGLAGRLMTAAQFAAADRAVPSRLVRARDVLAFEWTKLRSVRSNYLTLLIAAMATIGSTAALLAAALVITRRDA
jgi:ABC-type branched-subunit amino acid transport system ATPase component